MDSGARKLVEWARMITYDYVPCPSERLVLDKPGLFCYPESGESTSMRARLDESSQDSVLRGSAPLLLILALDDLF